MKFQFKSSINTKFDLGKTEIFEGYIPTTSHILPLYEILNSSFNLSNKKSHLIIGPYGTGKSYLTTLICSLISKQYSSHNINELIKKFNDIGEYSEIVQLISSLNHSKFQYIPVLMNGNEGSFKEAVIKNLYSSINKFDDSIVLPGLPQTVRDIIFRWKSSYPDAYTSFLKAVDNKENEFLTKIDNFDPVSFNNFKNLYSDITFGEQLSIKDINSNFIQTIEEVLNILSTKKLGIVLAYDEFGRFLQTLSPDEIYDTMQDIQDLAELANNGSKNFELMLISHKNLNSYFQNYSDELKNEFNRIEGRFSSYAIKSDQNVFASIIKNILKSYKLKVQIPEDYISKCEDTLRLYNLFDDLTPKAITELVIKGCYPMHPVTLWLLSSLSNIYGQNERTLFTFSESSKPGGLKNFLDSDKNIMYPSYLYKYFFEQDDTDSINNFKLKKISNNIDLLKGLALDPNYINIYTFICLWELVGLNEKQKLTKDFISFAFLIQNDTLDYILEKLISLKIVRYNYRLNRYETTEGSSLNMEACIKEVEDNATFDNTHVTSILSSMLPSKYKKIVRYNEVKQMTRYANLELSLVYDINDFNFYKHAKSDMQIYYLILDNKKIDRKKLIDKLTSITDIQTIFCLTNIDISVIEPMCKRIHAIDILMNNDSFLSKDNNAELELQYLKDETIFNTEKHIDQINNYSKDNIWIYNNEQLHIASENQMQSFLSNCMFNIFPKTPVISNDLYNRRNITGAQKKAGIKVIESILDNNECSGSGPDHLLYYSVFTNNGYNFLSSDNSNSQLFELKSELTERLRQYSKLEDIISLFTNIEYGYGIREPLIPILFVGLLSDVWENLLFFNKDSFLMNLDPENIYEIFMNPEGITFKYHSYTDNQLSIINEIIQVYGVRELDINKPKHIKASNSIYFWLKSLPRYSQISLNTQKEIIHFRDIINYLSIDPIEALNRLYENFNGKIIHFKEKLDDFVQSNSNFLLHNIYNNFNVNSYQSLINVVNNSDDLVKLTNPLVKLILNSTDITLIDNCSQQFIGISVESWSDNTVEVFNREMLKYCKQIINDEYDLSNSKIIKINDETKIIKNIESYSLQAINLKKRIDAMINAQNSRVSKDEITNILFNLLQDALEH